MRGDLDLAQAEGQMDERRLRVFRRLAALPSLRAQRRSRIVKYEGAVVLIIQLKTRDCQ